MRGTHEHRMDQVFMGGRDKPGHDDWVRRGGCAFVSFVSFVVQ